MIDTRKSVKLLILILVLLFSVVYYRLISLQDVFRHDTIGNYGTFHYYIENLKKGIFPYWDPYTQTGTYFYPNIPTFGLLDPTVLLGVIFSKTFNLAPLTIYIFIRLFRLLIVASGAYYLYKHITSCRVSSLIGAGVLTFSLAPSYFVQSSVVDWFFLTPFTLYFLSKFLDNPDVQKRRIYLSCLSLMAGITINIFIPSFYIFNTLLFLILLLILRIVNFREVVISLGGRRLLMASVASLLLILMMAAPSLITWINDASRQGELFPYVRIYQKNNDTFKKIMASDINTDILSSKFTNQQGVFNSWGDLIQLLYPDIAGHYLVYGGSGSLKYFSKNNLKSEINFYMGTIPFLFCFIGIIYHKSRYKYLALTMTVLVSINMFSLYGVDARPFNLPQKIFNFIFPPLAMIEVRESMGSYFLFYLCLLSSMGISFFIKDHKDNLVKLNFKVVIIVLLAILLLKFSITDYFDGKVIFTSLLDISVLLQIILFALSIYLSSRNVIPQKAIYIAVLIVILFDLFSYSLHIKKFVLQDSRPYYDHIRVAREYETGDNFQYLRYVLVKPNDLPRELTSREGVLRRKGAILDGSDSSIFTTKRYYDYLTHVPPEKQLLLSGSVFPILNFYPLENVRFVADKRALITYFETTNWKELIKYLYIDDSDNTRKKKAEESEIKGFRHYDNITWLKDYIIVDIVENFFKENPELMNTRQTFKKSIMTPDYELSVLNFSPNEILIGVHNKKDGYLYYNDGWSRYWQAFDDQRELHVKIANYNFKAVYLPKGKHNVKFIFNPVHYKIGLMAYYTGLVLATIRIAIQLYRNHTFKFSPFRSSYL